MIVALNKRKQEEGMSWFALGKRGGKE